MLSPMTDQRPDSSQSSRGLSAGRRNSWPILSISSRTMAMILLMRAVAEEEVAVDAGAELADVAGAEQELVAGDFGVCGGFAEGGDEELGPAMHGQRRHFPACCIGLRRH